MRRLRWPLLLFASAASVVCVYGWDSKQAQLAELKLEVATVEARLQQLQEIRKKVVEYQSNARTLEDMVSLAESVQKQRFCINDAVEAVLTSGVPWRDIHVEQDRMTVHFDQGEPATERILDRLEAGGILDAKAQDSATGAPEVRARIPSACPTRVSVFLGQRYTGEPR